MASKQENARYFAAIEVFIHALLSILASFPASNLSLDSGRARQGAAHRLGDEAVQGWRAGMKDRRARVSAKDGLPGWTVGGPAGLTAG
jgi:hypothetical protein